MHTEFFSLHEFMLHAKSITYIVMAVVIVAVGLYWKFLSGGDKKRTF